MTGTAREEGRAAGVGLGGDAAVTVAEAILSLLEAEARICRPGEVEVLLGDIERDVHAYAKHAHKIEDLEVENARLRALLHEIAVAQRGDHPDVDIEPDELPDEIRAGHRAWAREHEKVEVLLDAQRMVLAIARGEEHGEGRWEDPLDVPSWVAAVRAALGASDDRCQGADERRARGGQP